MSFSVKLDGTATIQKQVRQQLRERILKGEWPPGTKLPSIPELAAAWNVSYCTVHTALTPLVKTGLLLRKHGQGTFVAKRQEKMTCVGLYYGDSFIDRPENSLHRELHHKLCSILASRNIGERTWIDSRPQQKQRTPLQPLLESIHSGEIQCVIAPMVNAVNLEMLKRLPIPTVFFDHDQKANRVERDYRNFFSLAFKELAQNNCTNAAIIHPFLGRMYRNTSYQSALSNLASKYGIQLEARWIQSIKKELHSSQFEAWGYNEVQCYWEQSRRPGALIVYPDSVVRGAILGLSAVKVEIPREVRLVFHRHEDIEIFCPFPASWVVSNVTDLAKALLKQVEKQIAGIPIKPIKLPFKLVTSH